MNILHIFQFNETALSFLSFHLLLYVRGWLDVNLNTSQYISTGHSAVTATNDIAGDSTKRTLRA